MLIVDRDEEHARRTAKIAASELWVARAWDVWAGDMQDLVMQNDFRGGNMPIVGCLETRLGRWQ